MIAATRNRRRLRRWSVIVATLVIVGVLAIGVHVRWFSAPGDWRQVTGWDRIPARERPITALPAAFDPESPEIRWLGHSGFRIVWGATTVLLDPNTSAWCTISRRALDPVPPTGPADVVLISHAHFDHLDLPTLRAVGRIGVLVLPAGSEDVFDATGLAAASVRPIRAGERMTAGDLEFVAVPAAHNSSRLHPFRGRAAGLGYVIRRGTRTVYYAGDTGFANDFAAIRRDYRPDVAILPIGAFAPRFPMRYYHLSPEEAVAAARILDAARVIPCHFGTFALSLDRPDRALPRFARAAAAAALRWEMPELLTLAEGERSKLFPGEPGHEAGPEVSVTGDGA